MKGRSQGRRLTDPHRLLRPLRRDADGRLVPTSSAAALDEVAARLAAIRDEHGPRAIAGYAGTMAMVTAAPTAMPFYTALHDGLGTPMRFDPNSIDKGGEQIAQSFLGRWGAPPQGFDAPEAILLLGINPWTTHTGFPAGSPKRWIQDQLDRGCRLVVVDPRETQLAQRADWFLQVAPGHDVALLAAMLRVVVDEELHDAAFVARHVSGLADLRRALRRVDVGAVAAAAGVATADLVGAARCYASARRGFAMAGTGANMSGDGSLVEYLVGVLETQCGRWLREGELVRAAPTLLPVPEMRAEVLAPDDEWRTGPALRVRGLHGSRSGVPTAALPDEILTPGEGRVRALVSWGGNPAVAFPDQGRTARALRELDLFVQIDPWFSESARLADVVVPATLPLEAPSTTVFLDALSMRGTGYGPGESYAQYGPAAVPPPADADVLEDWRVFHGLLRRLGYPAAVRPFGSGPEVPAVEVPGDPDTDELLDLLAAPGGRVGPVRLRSAPGGVVHPAPTARVGPARPGATARLQVGARAMLDDLRRHLDGRPPEPPPLQLICRREGDTYNTSPTRLGAPKPRDDAPNPAHLHPAELAEHDLREGDEAVLANDVGRIRVVVAADPHLRRGVVSMAFGHGGTDDRDDPRVDGSSPSRLVSADGYFDRYTGQPRMTAVPVTLTPSPSSRGGHCGGH